MTRLQAWLLLLPVVLVAGFASGLAGGCLQNTGTPMLTVEKNDSPDPVNTGAQITYTIDVSNDGSGLASNVQLVDNLPAGTTFVSAMATQGSCVPAGPIVNCLLGDIPPGMSAQVTITVLAPNSPGQITNNATAVSAEMATDQDTETTDVVAPTPPADLQTSVTSTTQGVIHNGPATATLEVQNLSNTAASGVTLTGTLPPGAALNAAGSSPNVTVNGNVITANLGSLTANAIAAITVAVDFAAATSGAQLTMTASHSGPDPVSSNDAATATLDARDPQTDIVASPCTATSLTGDPQDAWDVDCPYANNGTENVLLDFTCSNDTDVLLQAISDSGGTACTAGANGGQCANVLVPAGGQVTIHQDIEPQTPGANETGSCSAAGLYTDTALGDEVGLYSYDVDDADFLLTDSCPGCSAGFVAGAPFNVTYNEINQGDAVAPGTVFHCQASAGVVIDSVVASEGVCTGAPGTTVSCPYDSDVNEAHTFDVTAHGLAGFSGQESLDCDVTHPFDPDPTGAVVSTAVLLRDPVSDLSCGCTSSCSGIDPENTCSVSCTCSNLGPELIADAQFSCPFSQDVTLESQTCDRGLCTELNETLDWSLSLAPGDTGTVDLTLKPGAAAAGSTQNFQCNGTFTGTDTDLLNNDPVVAVDVDEADLLLNGQCPGCSGGVAIGTSADFLLDVTNAGDAPANLGRVTCSSGSGLLRIDSAFTADGGESCSGAPGSTATCDDPIAEGETENYTVRFTPQPGAQPQETITCTALDPFDPTPAAPFTQNVQVNPAPQPDLSVTATNFLGGAPLDPQTTTFVVSETANAAANGVSITLQLSPNIQVLSINSSDPSTVCNQPAGSCTADFSGNDSETFTVTAQGTDVLGGTLESIVLTATDPNDLNPADNFDQADYAMAALTGINADPDAQNVPVGTNFQYTANGNYSDGSVHVITRRVAWSTDDATIADVSNAAGSEGLVTGNAAGTANITATAGSISDTVVVTVTSVFLEDLAITSGTDNQDPFYTAVHGTLEDDFTIENLGMQDPGSFTVSVNVINATLTNITVTPPGACTPDVPSGTCTGSSFPGGTSFSVRYTLGSPSGVVVVDTAINAPANNDPVPANDSRMEQTVINSSALTGLEICADLNDPPGTCPDNLQIPTGGFQTFLRARGFFSDGSNCEITQQGTWSSSDMGVATVGNTPGVDKGLLTSASAGMATVTATLGAVNDTIQVDVTSAPVVDLEVTGVDFAAGPPLTPTQTQVTVSEIGGVPANGLQIDYTASVSLNLLGINSSLASVGCIQPAGPCNGDIPANGTLVLTLTGEGTDVQGGTNESVLVTATLSGETNTGNNSVQVNITVQPLTSIDLIPNNPVVAAGQDLPLCAQGHFGGGAFFCISEQATWSSSNDLIATVDNTPGNKGVVTGVAMGMADVTAAVGPISGQETVTVNPAALNSILVRPNPGTVTTGQTQQFTATAILSDGTQSDITSTALWGTSNSAVATVSNTAPTQGLVTTVVAGVTDVTAMQGGITGTANLTVTDAILINVTVTPNLQVAPPLAGFTVPFTAQGFWHDGRTADVTNSCNWTPGDPSIATVSNNPGSEGLVTVVGVLGFTEIFCTYGGFVVSGFVSVENPTRLDVAPPTATINPTDTLQFQATGTFSDNSTRDLTQDVAWTSSDSATASVDPNGLVTGVAGNQNGVTITADFNGVTDTSQVFVLPPGTDNFGLTVTGQQIMGNRIPFVLSVTLTNPTSTDTTATQVHLATDFNTGITSGSTSDGSCGAPFNSNTELDCTVVVPANGAANVQVVMFSGSLVGFSDTTVSFVEPLDQFPNDNSTVHTIHINGTGALQITPNPIIGVVNFVDPVAVTVNATSNGQPTHDVTTLVTLSCQDTTICVPGPQPGTLDLLAAGQTLTFAMSTFQSALATVTAHKVADVEVTPGWRQLASGDPPFPFRAERVLEDGSVFDDVTEDPGGTWSSDDNAVAAVSNALGTKGLVTPGATGTANIQFDFPPFSDSALVEVNNSLLPKNYALFVDQLGVDTEVKVRFQVPAPLYDLYFVDVFGPPDHTGPDSLSVAGNNIVAGFTGSNEIASFDLDEFTGEVTEINSIPLPLAPGDGSHGPGGTCYSVPVPDFFTGNSAIGSFHLDATHALVADSVTPLPNVHPQKLRFNPLFPKAYVCDGDNLHIFDSASSPCSLTATGTVLTFAGRRDFAVDPQGEFLFIITLSPQFTSEFILQPLSSGDPSGPPITVALPTPVFAVFAHPTQDVAYALGFFGSITPISFDRTTSMVTVQPAIPAPAVNTSEVDPNGDVMYWADFNNLLCQVPLNQGLPAPGPPTCTQREGPPPNRIRFAPN